MWTERKGEKEVGENYRLFSVIRKSDLISLHIKNEVIMALINVL